MKYARLICFCLLVPMSANAAADQDVYDLIDSLLPVSITVDGDASDWGSIPAFADPTGDAGGDASRDITSVRIAPTDTDLYVLIETDATPASLGFPFWIRFDFDGFACHDVEIAPDPIGNDGLSWFDQGGCSGITGGDPSWNGTDIAIGSAVEIRVPYSALDAALPASMQGKLSGAAARPWVRVSAFSVDYLPGYTEVDRGAAVGSYRLVTTPYDLDSVLPSGGTPFTAMPSPLAGRWYVGQGAMNPLTHSGKWAYDLHRTDGSLQPENPIQSAVLADNHSYGEVITAPVAGTVYSLENAQPDCTPYSSVGCAAPNFVFLEVPGDLGLLFSHTIPGSIPYAASDPVGAGAVLGTVGNSGSYSSWPHLHYEGQDLLNSFASVPLGMTNVVVGLNPTLGDPWQRTVASWGLREGYFVSPAPIGVPLAPGVVVVTALLGLGIATALRSGR